MKTTPRVVATFLALAALGFAQEPIRLLTDFALSPDGKSLVFSYGGDVFKASSDGGAVTRMTFDRASDRNPRFSPDGKQIAFVSSRTGTSQVFTMAAEGGVPKQHTYMSDGYSIEEYAPTGERLLTRASRDHYWRSASRFFEVSLEQRTAEKLWFDDYGTGGTLAPDGQRMLFAREGVEWWRKGYRGSEASQIWLFDRGNGEFREIIHSDAGARNPMWRQDGAGFYYLGEENGTYNLYERDFPTGTTRRLTDFEDDGAVFAAISRDGSTIVLRRLFDLYRFEPASKQPPKRIELVNLGEPLRRPTLRRFVSSAESAVFSPDGLETVFVAGGDLWAMDTELKEPIRITSTPEPESEPLFSPDGKTVFFVSDQTGQSDLWAVERADEDQYWWRSRDFIFRRLTQDVDVERELRLSPDGTKLSFVRGLGDLMTMDLDGKNTKRLLTGFDAPDYDWSPDGKWITYSVADENFNSDIWIVPADGSKPPFNVSVHPDNDYEPRWSPDGRILAFAGRRNDDEIDVHYVWLRLEDETQDSRDRRLKKALEKMEKERKSAKSKEEPKTAEKPPEKPPEKPAGEKKPEVVLPEVKIDFEGLTDRIRSIRIADSSEGGLLWIDDKKLTFNASIDGKGGLYAVEFPDDLTPKNIGPRGISRALRATKAKLYGGTSGGQPATINAQGNVATYAFQVPQELDLGERNRVAFFTAWRAMRDGFYDDRLGNRNWDAVRRKYEDIARDALDSASLAQVVQMMLGELNGSHLGFTASGGLGDGDTPPSFVDVTAHLGLRFDPKFAGPGWKVAFVWSDGPTREPGARVEVGEVVLSVDGRAVDPALDPSEVLNGPLSRDVKLRIQGSGPDRAERDVVIRPISYGAARGMLYEEWIDHNRKVVSERSQGRLGYLHIAGMDWPSFVRFDAELYKIGYGKDGLIIDVRANGGGSTADHLLTSLTQPLHAVTVPRGGKVGYPQDRQVYASWNKPIIVLCDQNSFSNAEIFAHAIKTLKRGRLVGVRTAGGVISTGGTSILDVGFLRMPFRGWFHPETGEDMELNGAVPDLEVWPKPGDLPAGKDEQLEKAIDALLEDVKLFLERPKPETRKSSQRPVK